MNEVKLRDEITNTVFPDTIYETGYKQRLEAQKFMEARSLLTDAADNAIEQVGRLIDHPDEFFDDYISAGSNNALGDTLRALSEALLKAHKAEEEMIQAWDYYKGGEVT